MQDPVERRLLDAIERGEFENLPNAGQPLDLSQNPFVSPDWQVAYKILKDNHFAPEFVERRKEIETIRNELRCMVERKPRALRSDYLAKLEKLSQAVLALNRSLMRQDHFVQSSLQMNPIDLEEELKSFELVPTDGTAGKATSETPDTLD